MIYTAYHGTSHDIEFFDLTHLGENQGQSVFAGIYFTTDFLRAKEYANLSSEKTSKPPKIYVAEIELNNPLKQNQKLFNTYQSFLSFAKEYFPDWFNEEGLPLPVKRGYLEEKFSTYYGQYNFLRYAAESNGLSVIQVEKDLGFDGLIDGPDIVVVDPNSVLSFEEFDEKPSTESALETIADRYIIDSRHGEDYKTMPGNRYKQRMHIRTEGGNRVWYDIDVNRFFNLDEFTLHIPIIGQTDEYIEEIQLKNWLPILKSDIQKDGFSVMAFKKSLTKAMRTLDIKCRCSCPDFKFRFDYWFTVFGDNPGVPETRPAKITNPQNKLGRGCKHLLFVLSNRTWITRIARIFFNYCFNLYKQNKPLFERTIAKKLNITDEMVENRPILRRKPKEPVDQLPQEELPQEEQPAETLEVQQEVEEPVETEEKPAGEAYYSNYYRNARSFDENQQYMIDTAKDLGIDVKDYITPQNSPEQIWEVTKDIQDNIKPSVIKKLSDPDLSLREHQVLREAYEKKVDLFPYIGFDPDILRQLFLGAKKGIPLEKLALKGFNHRQIEQLRVAYELDEKLYEYLKNSDFNYEEMRKTIKQFKENRQ